MPFPWFIGAVACHEKYAGAFTPRPQQRVSARQTAVPDLAVVTSWVKKYKREDVACEWRGSIHFKAKDLIGFRFQSPALISAPALVMTTQQLTYNSDLVDAHGPQNPVQNEAKQHERGDGCHYWDSEFDDFQHFPSGRSA